MYISSAALSGLAISVAPTVVGYTFCFEKCLCGQRKHTDRHTDRRNFGLIGVVLNCFSRVQFDPTCWRRKDERTTTSDDVVN